MSDCATIRPLLPAFVVDALEEDVERDAARTHVTACAACAGEVETLGRLLGDVGDDVPAAPDDVWDRIVTSLEDVIAREAVAPATAEAPWLADAPVADVPDAAETEKKERRAAPAAAPAAEPADPFAVGPYELLDVISRGATGVVFRAQHRALGRVVALKVLHEALTRSPEHVRRFREEAEALARLNHPGIVPVYETGTAAGQHYLAMGMVDGEPLAAHLARGERWAVSRVVTVVARLARAVHHAHSQGLVHRDLKPDNVLVVEDRPVVTDFGLAGHVRGERQALAATGEVHGTPHYMAPEQVRGGAVDRRADIWSLGVIVYQLLTHELPFPGQGADEVQQRVLDEEPTPPRALDRRIDARLEAIVLQTLEKDPAHRYASALELASDLERAVRGESVEASKSRIQPWRARSRLRRFAGAAVTGVLIAGGVGVAALREDRARGALAESAERELRAREAAAARVVEDADERLLAGERLVKQATTSRESGHAEAALLLAAEARGRAGRARDGLPAAGLQAMATQRLVVRADALASGADLETARALAALGRAGEAVPVLRRVVDARPQDLKLRKELALVQVSAGQMDAARETLRAALGLAPNDPEPHLELARLERDAGRLDEALVALGQALELQQGDAAALLLRAEVRLALGEPGPAQGDAGDVTTRYPERADGWFVLGRAHHAAGDLEGARLAFEAALRLTPHGAPERFDIVGAEMLVLLDRGSVNALERLLHHTTLEGAPPRLHEVLGLAREASLDEDGALAAYARALDVAGADGRVAASAQVRLARLELVRSDAIRCRLEAAERLGPAAPLDDVLHEAARLQVQRTERARAALAAARRARPHPTEAEAALLEARLALADGDVDVDVATRALGDADDVELRSRSATTHAPWPRLDEPHVAALERARLEVELAVRAGRAPTPEQEDRLRQQRAFATARAGARATGWFAAAAAKRTRRVERLWRRSEASDAARAWAFATFQDPSDARAWLARARLARRAGQWDEAVALVRRALQVDPSLTAAQVLDAELFGFELPLTRDGASARPVNVRDPARARAALARLPRSDVSDARLTAVRAALLLLEDAPDPAEAKALLRPLELSFILFKSSELAVADVLREAPSLHERLRLVAGAPRSSGVPTPEELDRIAGRWLTEAAAAAKALDVRRALELADAAVELRPRMAAARADRASYCFKAGELLAGLLDVAESIRLEPARMDAQLAGLDRAKASIELRRAITALGGVAEDHPADARPSFVRAWMHFALGRLAYDSDRDLEHGLAEVETTLRLDPAFQAAHALRALLWVERAKHTTDAAVLERAQAESAAVRRLLPDLALAPLLEAVTHSLRGRADDAVRCLALVKDRSPAMFDRVKDDGCFDLVRETDEFKALLAR